ncbi:MAG TPA: hypothetical protein PK867_18760 [Pirellulales bacterium]|nr:hypothetical protein [Pirellulales bacterium]
MLLLPMLQAGREGVPDFFRDESDAALRLQADWLEQHLGLGQRLLFKGA